MWVRVHPCSYLRPGWRGRVLTSFRRTQALSFKPKSVLRDIAKNQEIAAQTAEGVYNRAKLGREIAELAMVEYSQGIAKSDMHTLNSEISTTETAIQKAKTRRDRTIRAREQLDLLLAPKGKLPTTAAEIVAQVDLEDRLELADEMIATKSEALAIAQAKKNTFEKYTISKRTKELTVDIELAKNVEINKEAAWSLERDRLAKHLKQIELCKIQAPADGMILYAKYENRVPVGGMGGISVLDPRAMTEEGATVRQRQLILRVVDLTKPMVVNTKVREALVDQVVVESKAQITVDAFPNESFTGVITKVAPLPNPGVFSQERIKVYSTLVK